jgi:hypothetical protein
MTKKMSLDPMTEAAMTFADLQDLRTVLMTVQTCLSARDLSDSAASLQGEVRYRPLTKEVERVLTRVKGLLGDLMLEHMDDEAPEEDDPEEDGFEEAERVAEYHSLLVSGLSDAEARATVWPEVVVDEELEEEELSSNPLGSRSIVSHESSFEWEEPDGA